jgi:hypothetical protein
MTKADTPSVAPIHWEPQRFNAAGDLVPTRFLEMLDAGSEHSGLLEPEFLVRETAQNSWDARRTELKAPVCMSFGVVEAAKGDVLHDGFIQFFGDSLHQRAGMDPAKCGLRGLATALKAKRLPVLYVRDVGTWGLGGPTDASVTLGDGGTNRYAKFMLNIGDANADTDAGGAFGLGRSVFWRMSSCRTVVVYTRCKMGGTLESRLVGLTISKGFDHGGYKYTGRNWWTTTQVGKPATGAEADEWSRRLGIEPYGDGETGTTAVVIAPFCPGGTSDLAAAIAGSIELHLWPKYVTVDERDPKDTMSFKVSDDGRPVKVRDRAELAGSVLGSYVECFVRHVRLAKEKATRTESESIVKSAILSYEFQKNAHPRSLGRLVTTVTAAAQHAVGVDVSDDEDAPFAPQIRQRLSSLDNSIALMRTPELIVRYEEVDLTDDPAVRVVGVFKSTSMANEFFRRSEDSSHASWSARRAPSGEQVVVRKFHELLRRRISEWYVTPAPAPKTSESNLATARIASSLGRWFTDWTRGTGGAPPPVDPPGGGSGSGGRGGGSRRPRAALEVEALPVEEHEGVAVNVWRLAVKPAEPSIVEVGLREADEDWGMMRPDEVAPGARPALVRIDSDREFVVDGSGGATKSRVFEFGPSSTNVTDVRLRLVLDNPTTITVRGAFDEGTVPVLVANVVPAQGYGGTV